MKASSGRVPTIFLPSVPALFGTFDGHRANLKYYDDPKIIRILYKTTISFDIIKPEDWSPTIPYITGVRESKNILVAEYLDTAIGPHEECALVFQPAFQPPDHGLRGSGNEQRKRQSVIYYNSKYYGVCEPESYSDRTIIIDEITRQYLNYVHSGHMLVAILHEIQVVNSPEIKS